MLNKRLHLEVFKNVNISQCINTYEYNLLDLKLGHPTSEVERGRGRRVGQGGARRGEARRVGVERMGRGEAGRLRQGGNAAGRCEAVRVGPAKGQSPMSTARMTKTTGLEVSSEARPCSILCKR